MTQSAVAQVFAQEWPKLVATLVRDLGDIDAAEEAAQQAFTEAAEKWGPDNTPDRPGAWLLTTARRRTIDRFRREARDTKRLELLGQAIDSAPPPHSQLVDDQLALIFGCCHPALDAPAQVALTLREVCGLSTRQIAAAFLTAEATMGKRLVRAKAKIRTAGIPFTIPDRDHLAPRLSAVLAVIYLIYTEGHSATDGASLIRGDLCDEARWLADLVADLLPVESEAQGLSALISLSDARRAARLDSDGNQILLEDQDRSLWDDGLIAAGRARMASTENDHSVGNYRIQATIALAHATAPSVEDTNWGLIASMYDLLYRVQPSPVVALNRSVAISRASGPEAGLTALDELDGLDDYRYYHVARADLLAKLDRNQESVDAYRRAIALTKNEAELNYLRSKLAPSQ